MLPAWVMPSPALPPMSTENESTRASCASDTVARFLPGAPENPAT